MSDHDDEETCDVTFFSWGDAELLPPAPHLCQQCAHDHPPEFPHNQQNLYWHFWFRKQHGRSPTWEDAMAHCSEEMKESWRFHLGMVLEEPQR